MSDKVSIPSDSTIDSQIGATLDALADTIHRRRNAGDESYTHRLLAGPLDDVLKKLAEESFETALAAKDASVPSADPCETDHLRYEAADVVYHLLVVLERFGITLDEFAAELNARMTAEEMPQGAVTLRPEFINRGRHEG